MASASARAGAGAARGCGEKGSGGRPVVGLGEEGDAEDVAGVPGLDVVLRRSCRKREGAVSVGGCGLRCGDARQVETYWWVTVRTAFYVPDDASAVVRNGCEAGAGLVPCEPIHATFVFLEHPIKLQPCNERVVREQPRRICNLSHTSCPPLLQHLSTGCAAHSERCSHNPRRRLNAGASGSASRSAPCQQCEQRE